jgi:hypothetical protein
MSWADRRRRASFGRSIASNVATALDLWARRLAGGTAIEVDIELTDHVMRAGSHSLNSGFERDHGDR